MAEATAAPAPLRALFAVIGTLERLRIRYAIGGSLASSLHGEPRSTADFDLLIELDSERATALVCALEPTCYVDARAAAEAVQRAGSFNVIHLDTLQKIDLFVAGTRPLDRHQLAHAVSVTLAPASVRPVAVTSAEDIVLRKLAWYREGGEVADRQWRDLVGVLKASRDELDRTYLTRAANEMDVADLLRRAFAEAGIADPSPDTGA